MAFTKGVEIMARLAGNAALQQPGSGTCPVLLACALELVGSSGDNPPFNDPFLDPSIKDQKNGGDILPQRVIAGHHFAGPARLGKVFDN
jgi:hypothetical protein